MNDEQKARELYEDDRAALKLEGASIEVFPSLETAWEDLADSGKEAYLAYVAAGHYEDTFGGSEGSDD